MPKAVSQLGRWDGFVVKRKRQGRERSDKVVSGAFETQDGAQTFLSLVKKATPEGEFYIAEQIRGTA